MNAMYLIINNKKHLINIFIAGFNDWLKEDAPVFGYLLKVLLASLLAMWISLRFELDQPRTAMLTVAIVMQSRSGMVFAKSYYRLLGTLVGIIVSFILVALFAQERILFLISMALWIGLCTSGSMVFRNHQSYGFVLAGYTICIAGLPAAISPDLTFNIGITRISEILVGLICATMVSDLIFPQRIWDVMQAKMRQRFSDVSDLLRTTANKTDATSSKKEILRFISDIYSLESFRASAIMENDGTNQQRLRLGGMNNEFMEVSTSFHTLEELLRRQRNSGHPIVGSALLTIYQQLSDAITLDGRSARNEEEATIIANNLSSFRNTFSQKLALVRKNLPLDMSYTESLDFETGAELLLRLANEFYAYALTYSSSNVSDQNIEAIKVAEPLKLEMHYDPLTVVLAGLRGTLTLGIMSAIWIFTDWSSGIEAITIGVVTSTLFATSPSPNRTVKQFMIGAIIGTALAYICNFHMLTQAQGFWMLALAVSPNILFATWLTTKPSIAVVGSGILIVFFMHIGFDSGYNANPVTFINDAIADLLAVMVSGIMYGLIDISSGQWSKQRTAKFLRKLIVTACRNPLVMKRSQLENSACDLVQRTGSAQYVAEDRDRPLIDWLLSTLELGQAIIALRELMKLINCPNLYKLLEDSLDAIASLHETPSEAHIIKAVMTIDSAIKNMLSDMASDDAMYETTHELNWKTLSMLHFIHSALLDEESVLQTKETN